MVIRVRVVKKYSSLALVFISILLYVSRLLHLLRRHRRHHLYHHHQERLHRLLYRQQELLNHKYQRILRKTL
jgi:Ca2+/H+ antiporter